MAQARCFGAGDLSDDHSFKELLGKWGEGSQAGQAPPPSGSPHPPAGRAVACVPRHRTSVCPPPSPQATFF